MMRRVWIRQNMMIDHSFKGGGENLVVLMYPVSQQIGCPPRQSRIVTFRPLPQSGINRMGNWIQQQTWSEVYECEDTNSKAKMLQNIMKQKLDEFFLPRQSNLLMRTKNGLIKL